MIEKPLLLDNNCTEVIPCELMPNEVVVIGAVPNKEILLLPKFEFRDLILYFCEFIAKFTH